MYGWLFLLWQAFITTTLSATLYCAVCICTRSTCSVFGVRGADEWGTLTLNLHIAAVLGSIVIIIGDSVSTCRRKRRVVQCGCEWSAWGVASGCKCLAGRAALGDAKGVEAAVVFGAEVDGSTGIGQTALMRAARGGHFAVIEVLLTAGARSEPSLLDGRTALDVALGEFVGKRMGAVSDAAFRTVNLLRRASSVHRTGKEWSDADQTAARAAGRLMQVRTMPVLPGAAPAPRTDISPAGAARR